MRTLLILTALVILVTGMFGCTATGRHSIGQNLNYMHDDTQRAFGLDNPSALHPRDLIANDSAEPYRGYP